jgi:hypothetical protein
MLLLLGVCCLFAIFSGAKVGKKLEITKESLHFVSEKIKISVIL